MAEAQRSSASALGQQMCTKFWRQQANVSNFAVDLLEVLSNKESGNIVVSPLSIVSALSLLHEGSTGKTAKEIQDALHLPQDLQCARQVQRDVLKSLLSHTPQTELEMAVKLFLHQSLVLNPDYKTTVERFYGGDAQNINFANRVETAKIINDWVSKSSHGTIEHIINSDDITSRTMMILVSSVFFKGLWKYPFPKRLTYEGKFTRSDGTQENTKFMKIMEQEFKAEHSEALDAKMIELPYQGDEFVMMVVLPLQKDGLKSVISNLRKTPLRDYFSSAERVKLNVVIPRFRMSSEVQLKSHLKKLKIRNIFETTANFSEISTFAPNLFVSKVGHHAVLEVTEEGSKGAGVTRVDVVYRITPYTFEAVHPFLFFIRHIATDELVFVGKYEGPDKIVNEFNQIKKSSSKPSLSKKNLTKGTGGDLSKIISEPNSNHCHCDCRCNCGGKKRMSQFVSTLNEKKPAASTNAGKNLTDRNDNLEDDKASIGDTPYEDTPDEETGSSLTNEDVNQLEEFFNPSEDVDNYVRRKRQHYKTSDEESDDDNEDDD